VNVRDFLQRKGFFRKAAWIIAVTAPFPIFPSALYAAIPNGAFVDRYAAIVIDANSGKTLFEKKAHVRRYPASLTKMMTLYMLFDALQSGRISNKTPIPVSVYAASRPPTKMGLNAGQSIHAETAAKALITRSANDVAVAIGEYLGGSEANFARMMTRKARRLGMVNTNFANASGLHDPKNYSTAQDMAVLSLALRKHFPRQYKLFNTTHFTFRGKNVAGHNRLVKSMKGVDGIKTGYTRMSGFNLASSRRAEGKSIVAVVMGGKTAVSRDDHMADLLVRYMKKASNKRASSSMIFRNGVYLPEGRKVPRPIAKTFYDKGINDKVVVTQFDAHGGVSGHVTDSNVPRPVIKPAFNRSSKKDNGPLLVAVNDRQHDSLLLRALSRRDFRLVAAGNGFPVEDHPPPVPILKANDSVE